MASKTTQTSELQLSPMGRFEAQLSGGGDTSALDSRIRELEQRIKDAEQPTALGRGYADPGLYRELSSLKEQRQAATFYKGPSDIERSFNELKDIVAQGPTSSDVARGVQSQRDLADMLKMYSEGGNIPSQMDVERASMFAGQVFQPERVAMEQAFSDQARDYSRRAAIQGRSLTDPILAAKLASEQTRQSSMLGARQGSFAAQFAQQQPLQRLSFASDRANLLTGLGNQAMVNRQAILGIGSQLLNQERNFRLNTATRVNTTETTPGFSDIAGGIIGGISTGISAYSKLSSLGAQTPQTSVPSGSGGGGSGFFNQTNYDPAASFMSNNRGGNIGGYGSGGGFFFGS